MSRIVVFTHLSLDGVMQAPGRPDEDRRGKFEHGGWSVPYGDAVMGKVIGEHMAKSGALLLGRRTYDDFAGYWPKQKDNPFSEVLNQTQKYVVSTTLKEPLSWTNSTLLEGDVTQSVGTLKGKPGKDIVVLGSGELASALMRDNLVDEYLLTIHPLVLGSGRRLFPDGPGLSALQLVDSQTTKTGVIIATYRPAKSAKAAATG